MNTTAERSTARQHPDTRLANRLQGFPTAWEEDARTFYRTAPEAAAAFSYCAKELAAALMECDNDTGTGKESAA